MNQDTWSWLPVVMTLLLVIISEIVITGPIMCQTRILEKNHIIKLNKSTETCYLWKFTLEILNHPQPSPQGHKYYLFVSYQKIIFKLKTSFYHDILTLLSFYLEHLLIWKNVSVIGSRDLGQLGIVKVWRQKLGYSYAKSVRPIEESRFYYRSNRKSLNDFLLREMECIWLMYHFKRLSVILFSMIQQIFNDGYMRLCIWQTHKTV